MDKPTTVKQAIKFLSKRYGISEMARSTDYKWVNMSNGTIGCVLRENEEGNITFQLCFSLPFGIFNYTEMHISHLGSASDLGVKRLTEAVTILRLENIQ